uniref:Uncharacterized protein n=1 Tax=Meloidogyne incognita TaxID=6306 RepID=A0A914L6A9_MELIC
MKYQSIHWRSGISTLIPNTESVLTRLIVSFTAFVEFIEKMHVSKNPRRNAGRR